MGLSSLSHLPAIHCTLECLMGVEMGLSLPLWAFHPGNQCLAVSTAGELEEWPARANLAGGQYSFVAL